MGVRPRQRPERLAEKLRAIRDALGLSQARMVEHLDAEGMIVPGQISEFESGKRERFWNRIFSRVEAALIKVCGLLGFREAVQATEVATVRHTYSQVAQGAAVRIDQQIVIHQGAGAGAGAIV